METRRIRRLYSQRDQEPGGAKRSRNPVRNAGCLPVSCRQSPPSAFDRRLTTGDCPLIELQADLVRRGHRMRVYVPYGTHWYPYFMRRLAERPANLLFFMRALVGD